MFSDEEGAVGSERVAKVLQQAEALSGPIDLGRLATLTNHPDAHQRLLALAVMRRQIAQGASASDYLALAQALIEDPDNDCRWQALIVVGESLATNPEAVWRIIQTYAGSSDPDLRAGIATVLLEHLLEEHFEEYFPKVRAEVLRGSARFAETVECCWFDDCEGPRYRRLQKLVHNAARGGFRQE
jgi:hypothetical protein